MELREAIHHRHTIRTFLPDPVLEETPQELIADAPWAPSWKNAQPRENRIKVIRLKTLKEKEARQMNLSAG